MTKKAKTALTLLLLCIGLPFTAGPARSQDSGAETSPAGTSEFRIVQLHPDLPPVRIQVTSGGGSGQVPAERLDYRSASGTERSGGAEDTIRVQRTDGSGTLLTTYILRAGSDRSYILALLPLGPGILVQSFFRDLNLTPPENKGVVQFFQAAPDAAAVEVVITDSDGHRATLNVPGFGAPTSYDTTLTPGSITVAVRKQGSGELLIEGTGILSAGAFTTVILSGRAADSTLVLSLLDQSRATAQEPLYRLDRTSSTELTEGRKEIKAFTVHPNPARDRLRAVFSSPQIRERACVRMFDLLGREALGRSIAVGPSGVAEIDISGLPPGAYHAVVEGKEGNVLAVRGVMVVR